MTHFLFTLLTCTVMAANVMYFVDSVSQIVKARQRFSDPFARRWYRIGVVFVGIVPPALAMLLCYLVQTHGFYYE